MSIVDLDTIVAPITAPGAAAVAVVRVSGAGAREIVRELCVLHDKILRAPRMAVHTGIVDRMVTGGSSREDVLLDHGLLLYFPAPHSFTGEDIAEFQLHGGTFIVKRLLENIVVLGARLAEPGEFSKRAFLNGKLDLTQTEAIADLIAAESEAQARVAREQLEGKLSHALSDFGEPLRDLLAEIEAYIDFPEEDIDPENAEGWRRRIDVITTELTNYIGSFSFGKICREGASVCLVGPPNAGKSSLLNRLLGEDRAIVTAIAGTTRDHIEERLSLGGLLVRFWDTAGLLDESSATRQPDEVERLGIERSWKKLSEAELVLFVFDAAESPGPPPELVKQVAQATNKHLCVANKVDLLDESARKELKADIQLSALSGEGIETLREEITSRLVQVVGGTPSVVVSHERHANCLRQASLALEQATAGIKAGLPPELITVDIRTALGALDDIIGSTYNEDILGRIFSKFCVGK